MERAISGFHRDEENDWVAELSCGHNQHVRHRPPFQLREWATDAEGRASRLGAPLECPQCDRAELPDGLRLMRSTPQWDEHTVPSGLLRAHRVARGTWGRIVVGDGRLRFSAATGPKIEVVLGPGDVQAIPPDVEHEVLPLGPVRFSVEFLAVDRFEEGGTERTADETELTKRRVPEEGGDPACWAQLLCPECGAVLEDDSHPSSCHANPERITNVTEGSVGEFIDHVAAHQPAPAGGAVAALCTAQASALLAMVARYSGGTTAADHVAVASTVLRESESLQARSLELMQLDVAAFMAVASAYALPRATREAEKVRSAAVEIALVDAAEPQAAVVEIAVDLSALIGQLLPFANRSVVTDLAAAAAATRAALFIARLNVEGNLTRASDPTVQTAFAGRLADVDRMLQKMDAVSNAIRSDVQDEGLPNRLHRRHTGAVPRPADTATEPSSLQSKDVR